MRKCLMAMHLITHNLFFFKFIFSFLSQLNITIKIKTKLKEIIQVVIFHFWCMINFDPTKLQIINSLPIRMNTPYDFLSGLMSANGISCPVKKDQ